MKEDDAMASTEWDKDQEQEQEQIWIWENLAKYTYTWWQSYCWRQ